MFTNNHIIAMCTYNLTQCTYYLHINIIQLLIYKNLEALLSNYVGVLIIPGTVIEVGAFVWRFLILTYFLSTEILLLIYTQYVYLAILQYWIILFFILLLVSLVLCGANCFNKKWQKLPKLIFMCFVNNIFYFFSCFFMPVANFIRLQKLSK